MTGRNSRSNNKSNKWRGVTIGPKELVEILTDEPSGFDIHLGAGLFLVDRHKHREANGLRVGYMEHRYAEMEGRKRRPRVVSLGTTAELGASASPTRQSATENALLKFAERVLAAARKKNDWCHQERREGRDPRVEIQAKKQMNKEGKPTSPFSFAAIWDEFIASMPASTIETYTLLYKRDVAPISAMDFRDMTRATAATVITKERWNSASGPLLRWFCHKLWEAVKAKWEGRLPRIGRNPFILDDELKRALGQRIYTVKHFKAMRWQDVPSYMARLRAVPGRKARAAEVTILEAKRSNEICGAWYNQINWQAETIEIRAAPRKGGTYLHPLSQRAMEILRQCALEDGIDTALRTGKPGYKDEPVFFKHGKKATPGQRATQHRQMAMFVRSVDQIMADEISFSFHGFRKCYKRWARKSDHPEDVAELCMGHKVVGTVQGAYLQYDDIHDPELLDEKRKCIEDWSRYCCSGELPAGEVVITNRKTARAYQNAAADWPWAMKLRAKMLAGEVEPGKTWQTLLDLAREAHHDEPERTAQIETTARRFLDLYKDVFGYVGRWNGRGGGGYPVKSRRRPRHHPAHASNFAGTAPADPCMQRTPGTYTAPEAAKILGAHESIVRRAIRTGLIAATKTQNGLWEIPKDEMAKFYENYQHRKLRGDYKYGALVHKVIAVIESSPVPLTATQIAQQLGRHDGGEIRGTLSRLACINPPKVARTGRDANGSYVYGPTTMLADAARQTELAPEIYGIKRRVLDILENSPTPLAPMQIAQQTGKRYEIIMNALGQKLRAEPALITKVARARYASAQPKLAEAAD